MAAKRPEKASKPDAPASQPKPTGRPSSFSEAIFSEICERISVGEPLRQICRDDHMPGWRTVYDWLREDADKVGSIDPTPPHGSIDPPSKKASGKAQSRSKGASGASGGLEGSRGGGAGAGGRSGGAGGGGVVRGAGTLSARFARARELGWDAIAEEALEIADDGTNDFVEKQGRQGTYIALDSEHVQRSKLRIETRLKLLAKWSPARYGDRIALTGAKDAPPIETQDHSLGKFLSVIENIELKKRADDSGGDQ